MPLTRVFRYFDVFYKSQYCPTNRLHTPAQNRSERAGSWVKKRHYISPKLKITDTDDWIDANVIVTDGITITSYVEGGKERR